MKQQIVNNRATVLHALLIINISIVIITVFTPLLWPIEPIGIYSGLAIGSLSVVTGIWTTIQYTRGKHYQSRFLGPCLTFAGLVMSAEFLFFFVMDRVMDACLRTSQC